MAPGYRRTMLTHTVPSLGRHVSAIGLGTWQLGADWGTVDEEEAFAVLDAAVESGVTLFDTADVYGDGRSEQRIGRFLATRPGHGVLVATKMGRRLPQEPESYTPENFRAWVDRSRRNLGVDTLDLVQLHCPPTAVLTDDATYEALEELVADGSIAAYGVSVETCDQALAAITHPGVGSVQIILNPFRLKPLEEVVSRAQQAGVGILARVPLASGLLSGRYDASTTFAANDHRTYNRHGEAFDQGETFSGVPYDVGLAAVADLAEALPDGVSLPAATLAWIASRPGVSAAIPGARTAAQSASNASALELLSDSGASAGFDVEAFDGVIRRVYDARLRELIHPRW